jgi:serine protease Do
MQNYFGLLSGGKAALPRLFGLSVFVFFLALACSTAPRTAEAFDPLQSVVRVMSSVPPNARTAPILGTERTGSGILIGDDGLVLTIGYLILEASALQVAALGGEPVPAEFVAYDHASGFGLLKAQKPLGVKAAKLGKSAKLAEADYVVAAATGGNDHATMAQVLSRRPFTGPWDYLLESGIFTTPPLRAHQGAGLFSQDGKLLGVGSLVIRDLIGDGSRTPGNLFIPIDLLKPILADLLTFGRSSEPPRPWIGVYPVKINGLLVVNRVATDSPAEKAGVRRGDVMLGVAEQPVREMDRFFRLLWGLGGVGVEVPLKILRSEKVIDMVIKSGDRMKWLRMNPSY